MFKRFARSLAVAATVLGLTFGTVMVSSSFTPDVTIADSAGQKGEIDVG